jgi:hypothetical protein
MKLILTLLVFLTFQFTYAERGGRPAAPHGNFRGNVHGNIYGGYGHGGVGYNFHYQYPNVNRYYYNNYNNLCRQYGNYYYYNYRPVFGYWNYFYNPMFFWFYANPYYYQQVFIPYYQQYYNVNVNQASEINYFPYANAFYPNEDLKEIGIEMSQADAKLQKGFVRAMTFFGTALKKRIATVTKTKFDYTVYSVIITKHRNIDDKFYELEGYVRQGKINVAYKALIDMEVPPRTYIIAP